MTRGGCNVRDSISKLVHLLDENLGRCSRCIKIAFICAFISWLAVLSADFMWPAEEVRNLLFPVAVGLTTLWLLHFSAYTARVLAALWSEFIGSSIPSHNHGNRHGLGRRDFLWVCVSALSIGVVASLWLPTPAFAVGNPCGEGRNCPDSAPNCCSRSKGKCCDGNWACTKTASCHAKHSDARKKCGKNGIVWACS